MSKPLFGMVLGGILGVFDGLTALISAPETRPEIVGIVIGSTFKGILTGLLIGLFVRKVRSLPLGIAFGLAMGLLFAYFVAAMQGKYYFEIMLPGAILGVIVGFATYQYGDARRTAAAVVTAALVLLAGGAGAGEKPAAAKADGAAALSRLKTLAGEWGGHILAPDGPPVKVVYSVTAGGSTVEEKLFTGTAHEMVTMYHLDGGDLVLTHYCAMGNQPRMKLVPSADASEMRFDFVGGGGIDAAKDMHMHAGRFLFRGPDRVDAEWSIHDKGKETGVNKFFLERVKKAAEAR